MLSVRAALRQGQDRLARCTALIPRDARVLLERQRHFVDHALTEVLQATRRELRSAGEALGRSARALPSRAEARLEREQERTSDRARRLTLVHPRRVLERGYSILRLADGKGLRDPAQAPAGSRVVAELAGGTLGLVSSGPASEGKEG
jgi:exodeoxyribonuclease VII large subunit